MFSPTENGPTEIIHRPEAGLARGLFETRPLVLAAIAALALIAGALYGAYRLGWLRRRKLPRK